MESIVVNLQSTNENLEFDWLTQEVIVPEFDQIIEALRICSDLLLNNSPQRPDESQHIERGPPVKLPILLLKLETLKGIITRDGAYITDLLFQIKEKHFNKALSRVSLKKPILLLQIITAKQSIEEAIKLIDQCKSHECHAHTQLVMAFELMCRHLQVAKTALQFPTDPNLIFPQHCMPRESCEPDLPPLVAMDVYINQAEICVDLKYLHVVSELPWGDIAPLGRSYVDIIKDEIQQGQPLDPSYITRRIHELASNDGESLFFSNMLNMMKPKYDPIDYVTKCVTYRGGVVMIVKKIEVASPDPVLVSAFTKLDSMEYLITRFLENLNNITK